MSTVDGRTHINDLQATLLAVAAIDHTQPTCRCAGRNFRLANVAGVIQKEILA